MVVVVIRVFDFVPFLIYDFIGKAYTDRDIYVILKHTFIQIQIHHIADL